jgi:hypothetical protein
VGSAAVDSELSVLRTLPALQPSGFSWAHFSQNASGEVRQRPRISQTLLESSVCEPELPLAR